MWNYETGKLRIYTCLSRSLTKHHFPRPIYQPRAAACSEPDYRGHYVRLDALLAVYGDEEISGGGMDSTAGSHHGQRTPRGRDLTMPSGLRWSGRARDDGRRMRMFGIRHDKAVNLMLWNHLLFPNRDKGLNARAQALRVATSL